MAGLIREQRNLRFDAAHRNAVTEKMLADKDYLRNLSSVSGLVQYHEYLAAQ